jgi:hypothetical protein
MLGRLVADLSKEKPMRVLILALATSIVLATSAIAAPPTPTGDIGIAYGTFTGTGLIVVTEVLEGGPADRAGLKPGMKIERVDGVLCVWSAYSENKVHLRGPLGSKVVLTLGDGREVTVVRDLDVRREGRAWLVQGIRRLEASIAAATKKREAARAQARAPLSWGRSQWAAHAKTAGATLAKLADSNHGWHDGRTMLQAIRATDYTALLKELEDEEDLDLLSSDDMEVVMLPVELHHLKLTATMLQAGREAELGNLKAASALAFRASKDDVSYSTGAGDFSGYERQGDVLFRAYRDWWEAESALAFSSEMLKTNRRYLAELDHPQP